MPQMKAPLFRAVLALVFVACFASGCESTGDMADNISSLWKDPPPPPLEGERLSVMQHENELIADPALASYNIALPRPASNNLWPQAGGYPNHAMGHLTLPAPNSEEAERRLIWRAGIGGGSSRDKRLTAQPIVLPRLVITLNTENRLRAHDRETGEAHWTLDLVPEGEDRDVLGGGMAFGEGRLYVTSGYARVLAINPPTGEVLWAHDMPAPARAAPTVTGGRVFVLTIDSRLIALDAESGEELWTYRGIAESAALLGAPSPAVDDQLVIAGFSSGEMMALRPHNGAVVWNESLTAVRRLGGLGRLADIRGMPVIDRGLVLGISHSGRMLGIEQRTGMRVWQLDVGSSQTPWVAGDVIYQLTNSQEVIAIHRPTGGIIWITPLQRYRDQEDLEDPIFWSGPVLASGRLILTGSHGRVAELDARTGSMRSVWNLPDPVFIPPVVANETLFLLTEEGDLLAYR